MTAMLYSIVRCVPEPSTGEFVNIAAIAGDPGTGEWAIRRLGNESRVRRFAGATALRAADSFIDYVGRQVDQQLDAWDGNSDVDLLGRSWLVQMYAEHRNLVQLSEPLPVIADDPEAALDLIFQRMLMEPETRERRTVRKPQIVRSLINAYNDAEVPTELIRPRVRLELGEHINTPIDFAIANGQVLQLSQAWSFQLADSADLSDRIRGWGYAIKRLRNGDSSRIVSEAQHVSEISRDVDIEVVVAPPVAGAQQQAYEEAREVFSDLHIQVVDFSDANSVGVRAAELAASHSA